MLEINHPSPPLTLVPDAVTTDVGDTVAGVDSDGWNVVVGDEGLVTTSEVAVGNEVSVDVAVAEVSLGAKTELVDVPLVPVVTMVSVLVGVPSESWYTTRKVPSGGGAAVVGSGTAVVVWIGSAVVVLGSMSPPGRVGTAYGGSKRPSRPQALQGDAHELTCGGAARIGSQCGSTMVAMADGSAVPGQSVPRSLRVSCCVRVPPTMVDTSYRSRGSIQFEVAGPAVPSELVPTAVGISMYTDGDVKV